jgi:DMSO/TMAO reductase YedYZ molybdopterin-dependent catalytic subunit
MEMKSTTAISPLGSITRRRLLRAGTLLAASSVASSFGGALRAFAESTVELPFENGRRQLSTFPQKRSLILQRSWPPLLETPMSVFDKGVFTPNDAFYVRWHLGSIPNEIDVASFRLRIHGEVNNPIELSLEQIQHDFNPVQLAAVNQCSGNSRGFFNPRVPGGEWGNGAMGNALWTGIRLKDLLERAGLRRSAVQVRFNGLDTGVRPETPDFMKALDLSHAMDSEVIVAYGMNDAALPMLNGFPLRLVVPGWFATYWVKMLNDIEVIDHIDDNFWMKSAYLIPDTPEANIEPGEKVKMVPINRMPPRSFITNIRDGAKLHAPFEVEGIAFGGDAGVAKVMVSADNGAHWQAARLDRDYGKYSFRRWSARVQSEHQGPATLMSRVTNMNGVAQPMHPNWNPGGYMRAVVESVPVQVV